MPYDLTSLGTPIDIPPGQVPDIDDIRGALTIQIGAPSLASGKVRIPINAANPFNASLVPYTGANIHLRWDPAVFTYSSVDNTSSILTSPYCATSVTSDADGGGVIVGCASSGGTQTTTTGLLATVVLTPAASGCSALHLFTYVKQDHGDVGTGTYVLNAFSNRPLPVGYADGSANESGQEC